MKALFGLNRKNEYPDHLNPEHPYYPPRNTHHNGHQHDDSILDLPSIEDRQTRTHGPRQHSAQDRLTTLEALQIIRRRFEESQRVIYEDQAA